MRPDGGGAVGLPQGLAINPSDVRARFNLAFVHTRDKNYRAALAMIADALALDKTSQYRDGCCRNRRKCCNWWR